MAKQREYKMDFLLNAKYNGAFSSAFSKAQEEFARLGKEIQSVQRLQSDIAAYQKQQAAVENTAAKLRNLEDQHELLQKEISETSGSTTALEREKLKLEQRISNTTIALERQTHKLEETSTRLEENGVDTENLTRKEAELAEKLKKLSAEQEEAAASMEEYADTASNGFEAVSSAIAAAGIAAALKEIAEAYSECISSAGDFEASMSNVRALSGATSGEMKQLTQTAKELGAETKYSALESADAMGYMAMAGWNAAEMISGMDGVLSLAAASNEELALVSDIVTDSMTAFGLTAADTSRYADVLAATATKSNTSVALMGETFKYAAPVAGALGYSIEDVSVAIGLMANSGIKGSVAGTSLRNMFDGLLEGSTLTAAAFGEYEYSAVKADGTLKTFSETLDDLRYYFDQMTEAEKVANAEAIAGMRGYSGLLAILNSTDEDFASLTDSINNCAGAAERMASIKMDNLNGDLELMDGAYEALVQTIGEQFVPEMRALYRVGADVFGIMDEFVQEHPAVIKGATAFIGVVGAATAAMTGYAAIAKTVKALNLAALFTGPAGITVAAVAGVAALTAGVVALSNAESQETKELRELSEASRQQYNELQELNAAYQDACSLYGETSDEARYLAWEIDELTESYEKGKQSLDEYLEECKAFSDGWNEILSTNREAFQTIGQDEGTTLALVHRLQNLAAETEKTTSVQEEMKAIIVRLNETVPDLAISYDSVATGAADYAAAIEATVKAQAEAQRYEQAQKGVADAYNAKVAAEEKLEQQRGELASAQERLNEAEQAYVDHLAASTKYDTTGASALLVMVSAQKKEYDEARKSVEEHQATVRETEELYQKAVDEYNEYNSILVGHVESITESTNATLALNGAIDETMARVAKLTEAYNEAYTAAYDSITGQYALWDEAAEIVETSAESINTALESQISYWQDYNENLLALTERSEDIEGLRDLISSFADGSQASVNAIAGMASASDEELSAMVENWKALQEEQTLAIGSIAELKTNFAKGMEELQTGLAEDIDAMDLSEDAAESGQATIQGYIDGALGLLPQVESAYAQLAKAAMDALTPVGGNVGFNITDHAGRATISVPGYAVGTHSAAPGFAIVGEDGPELVYFGGGEQVLTATETSALMQSEKIAAVERFISDQRELLRLPQFADGTENAPPGFAIVGEEGPELVYFGDEQGMAVYETATLMQNYQTAGLSEPYQMTMLAPDVLTAMNSYAEITAVQARMDAQPIEAESGHVEPSLPAPSSIQVVFQIEGNASPETVEALRDYGEEFAQRVIEVVEERMLDEMRREYR